jgi:hypothetical protein
MTDAFNCRICGHWSAGTAATLRRHGYSVHGAAYRANLGSCDAHYEPPLSTMPSCPICHIFIGAYSLEAHQSNAICVSARLAAPSLNHRDVVDAAPGILSPAEGTGEFEDDECGMLPVIPDSAPDASSELVADPVILSDWIICRGDELKWGEQSSWVGEVLLSPVFMYGPCPDMPLEQRSLNWKLWSRIRVVGVEDQVAIKVLHYYMILDSIFCIINNDTGH